MKLVLFCDYGLDDAAATADVLSHALAEGYTSADLVAVAGNVPAEVALANARTLAAHLPFPVPPVTVVDTTAYSQPCEFLKTIHGGDGMGDLFPRTEGTAPVLSFSEWVKSLGEGFVLVSLGPMTLVPYALERGPEKFVFMGGNVAETPNYKGYEFNHGINRAAFAACVKHAHVAVTMDTCRHPLFNIQESGIEGEGFLRRIVRRTREMTFVSGEKGCYVWDDIAVKYLRHPEWFTVEEGTDRDGNRLSVARYVYGKPFAEILDL